MSDEADKAKEVEELHLAAARLRRKPVLIPVGRCYNCDEEVDKGLFCDADCRDDYHRRAVHAYRMGD